MTLISQNWTDGDLRHLARQDVHICQEAALAAELLRLRGKDVTAPTPVATPVASPIVLPSTATITIDQAAVLLGISRTSTYRMAESGDLPTIQMGVRTRRVPTKIFLAKFGLA